MECVKIFLMQNIQSQLQERIRMEGVSFDLHFMTCMAQW